MAEKNLDGSGLNEVWVRAAQLVKRFTGAVNLTKGDLQTQVDTKVEGKSISSSSAITTEGEYALDAREKNASVNGTLANQISNLNSNLEWEFDELSPLNGFNLNYQVLMYNQKLKLAIINMQVQCPSSISGGWTKIIEMPCMIARHEYAVNVTFRSISDTFLGQRDLLISGKDVSVYLGQNDIYKYFYIHAIFPIV